jgi:hypothetical protein
MEGCIVSLAAMVADFSRKTETMVKKTLTMIALAIGLLAPFAILESSTAIAGHANADHLVYVPATYFHDSVSCDEARLILESKGYQLSRKVRCGGEYHIFTAWRRGFTYIIHVKAFGLRP